MHVQREPRKLFSGIVGDQCIMRAQTHPGGGGGAQYSVLKLNVSNYKARLLADHFLDPKVHSDGFVNNKPVFDRNLTFIDHVWGPGWWLRANQQAYIIDVLA